MKSNKFLLIFLSIALMLPITVWAASDVLSEESQALPVVNTIDDEVELIEENQVDYKVPIAKKKIFKKFLMAMGAVATSSFLIFFGLTAYNRFREKISGSYSVETGETSLKSPENLDEAVKIFLDKTNWS